jgi:L-amino acid N-acyltransferase YncA
MTERQAQRAGADRGIGTAGVDAAGDADIEAIQRIYAHHVLNGTGTFEERPPHSGEMAQRRAAVTERGLPYLVARSSDHEVRGFAYAAPFRPRSAYRFTIEDSVYVDPQATGSGVGRALLLELIERCTALGYQQMVAMIGDAGNQGSIALHRSAGFREAGRLVAVGRKFDRWIDVVFMQCALARPPFARSASPGL